MGIPSFAEFKFRWLREVASDHSLPGKTLNTAWFILDRVNGKAKKRCSWPSQETLARETGVSDRTVREHIAALERNGHLRVETPTGRKSTSRYWPILKSERSPLLIVDARTEVETGNFLPESRRKTSGSSREKLPREPLKREPLKREPLKREGLSFLDQQTDEEPRFYSLDLSVSANRQVTRQVTIERRWPADFTLNVMQRRYAIGLGIEDPDALFEDYKARNMDKNYDNPDPHWQHCVRSELLRRGEAGLPPPARK